MFVRKYICQSRVPAGEMAAHNDEYDEDNIN